MSATDLPIPLLVFCAIVLLYLVNCIKILREYERAVIFTLGRLRSEPKGPGFTFVFRPVQQMVRISLRQEVLEVPAQDVITRDNVTIKRERSCHALRGEPQRRGHQGLANYVLPDHRSFAQTTLRSVLGEVELDELLSHRDEAQPAASNPSSTSGQSRSV